MKYWLRILPAVLAAFLATAPIGPAHSADSYPSKPITLVAVFGPGSASDTICRVIAQPLSIALNENVIVENRPGANGALAAQYVARSAPDGYTLLMATNSPLSAVPFMMKSPPYDAVKDFTPITRMGSFTLMLVVHPSIPATNMKELIEYAKDHPGKLSFASANTSGIVAGETLKHWAEIDMLHVPYKSAPPALQDLIAGRVSMMFTDLTTGLPHVQSGKLRALAVTRLQRSSLFPELPTMDEAGVTGLDASFWHGLWAPKGTPKEIIARLNAAMVETLADETVKKRMADIGQEGWPVDRQNPAALAAQQKTEIERWWPVIRAAGIKSE